MAKKNSRKLIYVLRARCEPCGLDKMRVFYRVPNAAPAEMYAANAMALEQAFRGKYECDDEIEFIREIDKNYVWDLNKGKAVRR